MPKIFRVVVDCVVENILVVPAGNVVDSAMETGNRKVPPELMAIGNVPITMLPDAVVNVGVKRTAIENRTISPMRQ